MLTSSTVAASVFRQENAAHVLVRLTPTAANASVWLKSRSSLFDVVQKLPDGFVVTDMDRRVLTANTAFIELTQLATEEQVRGELIDRWGTPFFFHQLSREFMQVRSAGPDRRHFTADDVLWPAADPEVAGTSP